MLDIPKGLESIAVERERRLKTRTSAADDVDRLFEESLAELAGTAIESKARTAYRFASSIEYQHAGLSSASYLAHPVRVFSMALKVIRPADENAAVLALLHNVFELSTVPESEIAARFGAPIAEAIRVLTVDRTQNTREYTERYYRGLQKIPAWARRIKLLDKLDNMFILGLNPDADVRKSYLADIEKYVVPIAVADLPELAPYLQTLIEDCREVGFLETR